MSYLHTILIDILEIFYVIDKHTCLKQIVYPNDLIM